MTWLLIATACTDNDQGDRWSRPDVCYYLGHTTYSKVKLLSCFIPRALMFMIVIIENTQKCISTAASYIYISYICFKLQPDTT